jgi:hypothetical protein
VLLGLLDCQRVCYKLTAVMFSVVSLLVIDGSYYFPFVYIRMCVFVID